MSLIVLTIKNNMNMLIDNSRPDLTLQMYKAKHVDN